MLNSYRVKYSPETHELLKVLMDEAKISAMQRKQVGDTLNRGEPLPVITRRRARPSYVDENLFDLKRNYYFMRRSQEQIRHSGAYDRDRYRSLQPLVDKEKEKERLGNIMAFGTGKGPEQKKPIARAQSHKPTMIKPEERIEELIVEIQDRLLFLDEMSELGERKKYEDAIKQEIASKLRELERLDKNEAHKYMTVLHSGDRLKTDVEDILCWEK